MFEWTVGFKNTVLKSSHGFSEVSIPVRATIGWRTEWTGDLFPAPGPETPAISPSCTFRMASRNIVMKKQYTLF